MRAVVQRAARACVRVDTGVVGEIGPGLVVLLGVARDDDEPAAVRLAGKVARLRIFPDDEGRFDRSVLDTGGAVLAVSQFTLIADTAKGNRPSFSDAAPPEQAEPLYERFCAELRALGLHVETGVFGAYMSVELVNDGPVTVVLDLEKAPAREAAAARPSPNSSPTGGSYGPTRAPGRSRRTPSPASEVTGEPWS